MFLVKIYQCFSATIIQFFSINSKIFIVILFISYNNVMEN